MTRRRARRALHLPVVALIFAACVASAHTAVALDPEAPEDWTLEPWRGNALNSTSSSSASLLEIAQQFFLLTPVADGQEDF